MMTMNSFAVCVLVLAVCGSAYAATCSVTNSGGGDDTKNILSAFTSCASGGTIEFGSGTYHWNDPSTALPTLSGVTIKVAGTIQFPASTSYSSLSVYADIKGKNVQWSGGVVDGNGQAYWNAGKTGGPKLIRFSVTGSSKISGVTFSNSPAQHVSVNNCDGCVFSDVKIVVDSSRLQSGKTAANTDGFDVSSSNGVQILDATITNDDDCVAVNGGVTNLLISGMKCTGGHGVSIGSLGKNNANDIVSGVMVKDSTFTKTKYAARIKSFLVSGNTGYAKNITYDGITVDDPSSMAICVTQHYCPNSDCGSGTGAFNLEGATFSNFKFQSVSTSNPIVDIWCESTTKCGTWTFKGVTLPSGGKVGCKEVEAGQISGLSCTTTLSGNSPCN